MSDHPSTFEGTPEKSGETAWEDRAVLQSAADGDGILDGTKAIRRGTFAEMIRHIVSLPDGERDRYVIEKAGDREYSAAEAVELSKHADFPFRG
ncbi:MAG: hypothetical protein ACOCYR_08755 [Erythrobacter sp.]